jgi:hypothetical protein
VSSTSKRTTKKLATSLASFPLVLLVYRIDNINIVPNGIGSQPLMDKVFINKNNLLWIGVHRRLKEISAM